jgi:hypothetical protein
VLEVAGLPPETPTDVSVKSIEGIDDEEIREKLRVYLESSDERQPATPPVSSLPTDQIRGSMTLDQVADSYGLSPGVILEKTGWPADAPRDIPLKELKDLYGGEVENVREAVRELLEN